MLTLIFILLFLSFPGKGIPASYTVQKGDTLFLIGKNFGLSVDVLKSANQLKGEKIYPGQVLNLPLATFAYTVRLGDTLFLLEKRFGVPYRQIQALNNLKGTLLYPGQVLQIPARKLSLASRGGESPLSRRDLTLLAHLVYGEARGEPYLGQVAVAAVVLNRVASPLFPNTISEVIFQPGAFTAVSDGQFYLTPDETAYRAATDAANGLDPTGGALYYWNPERVTNLWIWSRDIIGALGRHLFAI